MKRVLVCLALVGLVGLAAFGQSEHWKVDVPAIQEEYGNPGRDFCDGTCVFIEANPNTDSKFYGPTHRRKRWTCADKTRILLTAEDGSKHCVRFPEPDEAHVD